MKKTTLPQKFINGAITKKELEQLVEVAIVIQKHWRGYVDRVRVHNQINMAHYRIQMNKKKIADLDPKFWDDAKSNSIIKGEDAQS